MKKIIVFLAAAALMLAFETGAQSVDASRYANYARYAEANAALIDSLPAAPGRVVLMGNSITDFWPLRVPQMFNEHPEIIGRGIAGQTSWQFLLRFRSDVITLNPEVVVINYGTNDIAQNSGPYNEDVTFDNVCSMVDIARANGIKVVLASTLPAEGFRWCPEVTGVMDKIRSLNARVRAYANAQGIPFVDYFSAMVNEEGTAMNPAYSDEPIAVHPNAAGYAVMARILLETLSSLKR